jgi:hypothetical protein
MSSTTKAELAHNADRRLILRERKRRDLREVQDLEAIAQTHPARPRPNPLNGGDSRKPVARYWGSMKKRLVAVLVAALVAFPAAGVSSAVAIRPTDRAPSIVAAPSFDNCNQMHRRWQ